MSWTPQKAIVICALLLSNVQVLETNGWGGSYDATTICGLRGSSVELVCTFWYPQTKNASVKTLWFTKWNNHKPKDLRSDPQYAGRLRFDCQDKRCRLSISQLRESDAGEYKFRFVTTVNSYTVAPGVSLTVTGLPSSTWCNRVLYNERSICAVKGSTVDISCTYSTYYSSQVTSKFWFTKNDPRDLKLVDRYKARVQLFENGQGQSTLRISNLMESDSADYRFRFTIEKKFAWTSTLPGTILTVAGKSETQSMEYELIPLSFPGTSEDLGEWGLSPNPKWCSSVSTDVITKAHDRYQSQKRNVLQRPDLNPKEQMRFLDSPVLLFPSPVVQVQVVRVTVKDLYTIAQLLCHLSCSPPSPLSFCWWRNGWLVGDCAPSQMDKPREVILYPGDYVSCAVEGYPLNGSARLYAPMTPSVSPSDPGEIVEGNSLILTCRTNPAISCRHRWFKKTPLYGTDTDILEISEGKQLVFEATKSSDSAKYFCTAENELGAKMSKPVQVDVKYAPRNCSLLVRPSKFPEEGQSVTLTCSNYANPETNYTLYRDDQPVRLESGGIYRFISIRPQDAGRFYCKARNEYGEANSSEEVIEVMYGPRPPEVSAKASDDIGPGSWVSLTCSSDAKPAASYAWYKATEEFPLTTVAVYNISDYQEKHAGEYRCVARNMMGSRNATLWLPPRASSLTAAIMRSVAAGGAVLVLLLVAVVLLRKKMTSKAQPNASSEGSRGPADDLVYSTVTFSKQPHIYSNVVEAQRRTGEHQDEDVEYSLVNCDGHALKLKTQEDAGASELYSAVQKRRI